VPLLPPPKLELESKTRSKRSSDLIRSQSLCFIFCSHKINPSPPAGSAAHFLDLEFEIRPPPLIPLSPRGIHSICRKARRRPCQNFARFALLKLRFHLLSAPFAHNFFTSIALVFELVFGIHFIRQKLLPSGIHYIRNNRYAGRPAKILLFSYLFMTNLTQKIFDVDLTRFSADCCP